MRLWRRVFRRGPPTASRVSGVPARVGKSGSSGAPWRSFIQVRSTATTSERNGVALGFSSFAATAKVGTGAQLDVAVAQAGEL